MKEYYFSDSEVKEAIDKLNGETRGLAIELFKLLQKIELSKTVSIKIKVNVERNVCIFILSSPNHESINVKIDIFHKYYDLFVKDEEIVIQTEIAPLEKSLEFISNHLKSTVEEILNENGDIRQINFYLKDEKINSVGSVSIFPLLFKNKEKRIIKYLPWLNA